MINSGISVSPLISWPFLDVNHQHLGVPNPSTTGSLVVSDLVISIHGLFRGMKNSPIYLEDQFVA